MKPVQSNAEQEWRCFRHATDEPSSKQPDDRLWYDDHPFERAEVGAVYFGAFMDIEDKQKLLSILREHYSEATVFEAERSEEHTSELQSRGHLVCRLLLEKKKEKISDR